jgi:hypothetical protein
MFHNKMISKIIPYVSHKIVKNPINKTQKLDLQILNKNKQPQTQVVSPLFRIDLIINNP